MYHSISEIVKYSFVSVWMFLFGLVHYSIASGNPIEETTNPEIRCVFFFIPDCPASRADMPAIMELSKKYGPQGLKFAAIMSDPEPNDSVLGLAILNYNFTLPVVYDTLLIEARSYGAITTPQVFLFDANDKLVYSGQVNNYYYTLGRHGSRVTKHYLEDAIVSLLEGTIISVPKTSPIGCKINFD